MLNASLSHANLYTLSSLLKRIVHDYCD